MDQRALKPLLLLIGALAVVTAVVQAFLLDSAGKKIGGLEKELREAKENPSIVYLCGTVKTEGKEHRINVSVTDRLSLGSKKPAFFDFVRQDKPCDPIFTAGGSNYDACDVDPNLPGCRPEAKK